MTNDTIFHCSTTWFITRNTIKTNPIIPVQRKKKCQQFDGIHLCYCYPWQPMLCSHEKWCHLSWQSCQTVPDIMSLFHKNRTKGLKMGTIKAQTDYHKDVLLATSAKLKTVKTGLAAGNISQAEDSENWTCCWQHQPS